MNMNRRGPTWLPLSVAMAAIGVSCLAATGCDQRHEIGDLGPGTDASRDLAATGGAGGSGTDASPDLAASGGAGRNAPPATMPDAGAPMVGPLGPTTTWTGYIENAPPSALSETLHMKLATDDSGNAVGTVRFG